MCLEDRVLGLLWPSPSCSGGVANYTTLLARIFRCASLAQLPLRVRVTHQKITRMCKHLIGNYMIYMATVSSLVTWSQELTFLGLDDPWWMTFSGRASCARYPPVFQDLKVKWINVDRADVPVFMTYLVGDVVQPPVQLDAGPLQVEKLPTLDPERSSVFFLKSSISRPFGSTNAAIGVHSIPHGLKPSESCSP